MTRLVSLEVSDVESESVLTKGLTQQEVEERDLTVTTVDCPGCWIDQAVYLHRAQLLPNHPKAHQPKAQLEDHQQRPLAKFQEAALQMFEEKQEVSKQTIKQIQRPNEVERLSMTDLPLEKEDQLMIIGFPHLT